MNDLDYRLKELVAIACQNPPGSRVRNRAITEIICLVSPKLWRENVPYYQDAVQRTWLYLTRRVEAYDANRAGVVVWLNVRLKFELLTLKGKMIQDQIRNQSMTFDSGEELEIPDPQQSNQVESPSLIEVLIEWARRDESGELRAKYMKSRPEVTCQRLILDRLNPENTWEFMAKHYHSKVPTLSCFYRLHCIPKLRGFLGDYGYE
jgi:hypothetical protein